MIRLTARNSIKLLTLTTFFCFTSNVFAGDGSRSYWVSPTGTAIWANCESATPLSGTSACSLSIANKYASAGDTVYLQSGTYDGVGIAPLNSGSSQNVITYQAYTGETPTITDSSATTSSGLTAIALYGNDYIKIDGIAVDHVWRFADVSNGSDYNEFTNCTMTDAVAAANGGFELRTNSGTGNTHNWIHGNYICEAGYVDEADSCNDTSNLMRVGIATETSYSNYNTIEDNILCRGGHHIVETHGEYVVYRNNVMYNDAWMTAPAACEETWCSEGGHYGNRVFTVADEDSRDGTFNLIENNRFGHAYLTPNGNGADNLTIGANKNIVRFNSIFNSQEVGIYFRTSSYTSDYNMVYNNTVYKSGQGASCRYDNFPGFTRLGVRVQNDTADGNVLKNNIIYANETSDIIDNGTGTIKANNWFTTDGNPSFVNTDVSNTTSTTLPDLSLQLGSGAINGGTYLTQANGSGSSSTTLIVDDALYFQDGSWGSSLASLDADYIAIGTVSNTVQISSINYTTNTITLASAMAWSDNASIWLYKDSSGRTVLKGIAPDIGSHEYGGTSFLMPPQDFSPQ